MGESLACRAGVGNRIDHLRHEGADREPPARWLQTLTNANSNDDEGKDFHYQDQGGQNRIQGQHAGASLTPEKCQRPIQHSGGDGDDG